MTKIVTPELFALVLTQIHLGIAKARVNGVVCGSPRDIKVSEGNGG
jgi:hypothetical protein